MTEEEFVAAAFNTLLNRHKVLSFVGVLASDNMFSEIPRDSWIVFIGTYSLDAEGLLHSSTALEKICTLGLEGISVALDKAHDISVERKIAFCGYTSITTCVNYYHAERITKMMWDDDCIAHIIGTWELANDTSP